MPNSSSTPTHREIRILGRAGGGALDPETGQRAHGGVCFYDGGEEIRCAPGDEVEAPVKVAYRLIADGLAEDPLVPAGNVIAFDEDADDSDSTEEND